MRQRSGRGVPAGKPHIEEMQSEDAIAKREVLGRLRTAAEEVRGWARLEDRYAEYARERGASQAEIDMARDAKSWRVAFLHFTDSASIEDVNAEIAKRPGWQPFAARNHPEGGWWLLLHPEGL